MTTLISFLGKGRLDPRTGYRFDPGFAPLLAADGMDQGRADLLARAATFMYEAFVIRAENLPILLVGRTPREG